MNGILFYFSGTGNTKWVADRIGDKLCKLDNTIHKVNIENLDDDVLIKIHNYDFIIIGTPIYAEMGPKLIQDFVNNIPKVKEKLNVYYIQLKEAIQVVKQRVCIKSYVIKVMM